MATKEELMLIKTNMGGWFFDAVLRAEHTESLSITQHPVETGAPITDHSFVNPAQVILDIGMSDVASDMVDGQYSGEGGSRSVNAYKLFKKLQRSRVPFQLVTKLDTYENMLIQTMVATDDQSTQNGLKATITLKEVFLVSVATVKLSARKQVTDSTKMGDQQPEPVKKDKSGAYQLKEAGII